MHTKHVHTCLCTHRSVLFLYPCICIQVYKQIYSKNREFILLPVISVQYYRIPPTIISLFNFVHVYSSFGIDNPYLFKKYKLEYCNCSQLHNIQTKYLSKITQVSAFLSHSLQCRQLLIHNRVRLICYILYDILGSSYFQRGSILKVTLVPVVKVIYKGSSWKIICPSSSLLSRSQFPTSFYPFTIHSLQVTNLFSSWFILPVFVLHK